MKIEVVIIIMNYNGKKLLRDCLNSIKKNTFYKDYKIIVVDNNSTDGSIEMIKKQFKGIDLIQNEKNYGGAKGNNIGIKYAIKKYNPNYFFLLHNDIKVTKDWLESVIKIANSHKKIGILGCKQLNFERKPIISAAWILPFRMKYYSGNQIKEVTWISGAAFLIKKDVIKKIGLFDEKYSPFHYDDMDFEQRAIKAGFKIMYVPNSIVLHKTRATTEEIDENFMFYMNYKNRMRCFRKNFPSYYLWLRVLSDIFDAVKVKKLPLLFKAYRDGIKSLK